MKSRTSLTNSFVSLMIALVFLAPLIVVGQSDRKLKSTPKAFQSFYSKFRSAVAKRDKNAVVSMTLFPFEYGWDAGDEGTYNRTQFISKFNDIFGSRKIFSQPNPTFYVENGSFNLTDTSDASHYIFAKKGSKYYFKAFIAEP